MLGAGLFETVDNFARQRAPVVDSGVTKPSFQLLGEPDRRRRLALRFDDGHINLPFCMRCDYVMALSIEQCQNDCNDSFELFVIFLM